MRCCSLLHDLHIDLLHVHLLVELERELGALEQPRVYAGRHGCCFCGPFFLSFFSLVDFPLRWLMAGVCVLQLLQTHQTGDGNVPFARWLCFGRAG